MKSESWRYFCQTVEPSVPRAVRPQESEPGDESNCSFEVVTFPPAVSESLIDPFSQAVNELLTDHADEDFHCEHFAMDNDATLEVEEPEGETQHSCLYPWCVGDAEMRLYDVKKEKRECYTAHDKSRLGGHRREGLLVDCGAIDNLSGKDFVERQGQIARSYGRDVEYRPLARTLEVNGVGQGSQEATHEAVVPIQIADNSAVFTTPVLSGRGAAVPGLWGLRSQRAMRALIDTGGSAVILPGPGGFSVALSPGSEVIQCEDALSGHMMVPVSDFQRRSPREKTQETWMLYGTNGQRGDVLSPRSSPL